MASAEINIIFSTAADRRTRDLRYRQRQFIALHQWIVDHRTEIETAVCRDEDLSDIEAKFLVASSLDNLRRSYDSLDLKEELAREYSIKRTQNDGSRREPEEVVYLIPDMYTLFCSVMDALYAVITAGSCFFLELPIDLRHTSEVLRRCFATSLDKTAFAVVNSRPPNEVLNQCLIIDQTASVSAPIGKKILRAEPTRQTVAIVDRTADLDVAAKEIFVSKRFLGGRGPYAPSWLLVNEFVENKFCELLKKHLSASSKSETANGSAKPQHLKHQGFKPTNDTMLSEKSFRLIRIHERKDLKSYTQKDPLLTPLLPVSSYDDAIDALNNSDQGPMLALYVFAEPSAAKYLTQFIHTNVSFVNYIPLPLLVGSAAPIEYPVSSLSRYHREMIESPSGYFAEPVSGELQASEIGKLDLVERTYETALLPLKPTGQPKEGEKNFFAQSILVAMILYLSPIAIGTLAGAGYLGVKLYNRSRAI